MAKLDSEDDITSPDLAIALGVQPVERQAAVASVADLQSLHGTFIKALENRLLSGKASAAEFSVIRAVLADNSITASMGTDAATERLKKMIEDRRLKARGMIPKDLIANAEAALDRAQK